MSQMLSANTCGDAGRTTAGVPHAIQDIMIFRFCEIENRGDPHGPPLKPHADAVNATWRVAGNCRLECYSAALRWSSRRS
jgi:hypothetical protein